MITRVRTVYTGQEVGAAVDELAQSGYAKENIYILSHDDAQTDSVAEATDTSTVGIIDEGVWNAVANLFRSKGDELRAKLKSMGVSERDAHYLEEEMDRGATVVIAWGGNLNFDPSKGDPDILYTPAISSANRLL